MKARVLTLLLGTFLFGCSSSASYQDGQTMADRTYGSMSMEQMTAHTRAEQVNSAMGVTIYKPGMIKSMFNQMRSSFRE